MKKYNMILTEKQQIYQNYHQQKLIYMNILQAEKYYQLIKVEQNKLSLHVLLQEKLLKSKQKRLMIKEKKQTKATKDNKKQLDDKKQGNNELLLSKKIFRNNKNWKQI